MKNVNLTIHENLILVRNPNQALLTAEIDGDLAMMDDEQGYYFGLNPIAKEIWEILESPTSVAHLIDKLVASYNVEHEQCQKDVYLFLTDMLKNNLLVVADSHERI